MQVKPKKVQPTPQAQPREDEREYINFDIEAAKARLQNGEEWSERFRQAQFNGTENALRAEYENLQENVVRAQEIQEKYKARQSENASAFISKPSQMQATELSFDELKSKLRDIEGAQNGDESSEWFRRLDAAWNSGDPEFYQAVEQEFLAQKEMVYEKLGLRDTGQILKDSFKNNSPMAFEHIAGLPLPEAEYSYVSRIKDNALGDPHSTEGLFNMDRARKALDDIPIPGKISGKAVATFVGESIKIVGMAMDSERIFTGLNQDYKDDGKIGLDSVRTVAKVLVGSLGAVGGAAVGTFFGGPIGSFAGGIGGSVLAETLVDTLFESIEDRKRRKEYAGT